MENNVLEDIDVIKKERKISKEAGKKIFNRAIINCSIGVAILLLVMAFYIVANYLSKDIVTLVYNISAITALIATLVIIEIAYKKDSGKWAITAVEMIVVSMYTLFAKLIFLRENYKYIYGFIALTTIYYTFKIIRIYLLEKKKFLTEISDITDIIKKESKDELAEQEKEKRKEELKKLIEEQAKAKKTNRKSATKKKTTNKKTNTTKTTAKKKPKTTAKKTETKKEGTAKQKTTTKKVGTTTKKATTAKKENNEQGE